MNAGELIALPTANPLGLPAEAALEPWLGPDRGQSGGTDLAALELAVGFGALSRLTAFPALAIGFATAAGF